MKSKQNRIEEVQRRVDEFHMQAAPVDFDQIKAILDRYGMESNLSDHSLVVMPPDFQDYDSGAIETELRAIGYSGLIIFVEYIEPEHGLKLVGTKKLTE